jgi:hypothetical protein
MGDISSWRRGQETLSFFMKETLRVSLRSFNRSIVDLSIFAGVSTFLTLISPIIQTSSMPPDHS